MRAAIEQRKVEAAVDDRANALPLRSTSSPPR
jgi:hypothetical protein